MVGLEKGITKEAVRMAWPAVCESFFIALAGMVDSLMVSSMGASAVAAVGLTTQPKFMGLALFFAMNVSVSALVARRRGEKNQRSANQILLVAILFVIVATVVISSACVMWANEIINFCGSAPETHEPAVIYYRIIMGCMIFNVLSMVINAAQRGSGNTMIAMRTNIVSNVVNIIANYLLIQGHLGFPALGIAGAAIATVFGTVIACIMSFASLFRRDGFVSIYYIMEQHDQTCIGTCNQHYKAGIFRIHRADTDACRLHVNCHDGCENGNKCPGGTSGRYEYSGTDLLLWRWYAGSGSGTDRKKLGRGQP